jgi:hypothetical protein
MNDEQLLSLFALFNDPIIQSRLSFLRGGGSQEVQNSNFQDSGSAAELPIQRTLSSNIEGCSSYFEDQSPHYAGTIKQLI